MAGTRTFKIRIVGDAKDATAAFKKISSEADTLTTSFSKVGSGFGKMFALAGSAIAIGGITSAIGGMVSAAYESQKVYKQTEAIIKATGYAAGVSADEIKSLADALSLKTGVDDEAIQTGLNLLLTFKQVRNEAGLGNDIFNRAAQAALDLGNVFGSVDGAAVQLGKALSDPVRGITALRRSGINFTQAQQDQIKALVAANDVLAAQKIILGEVESQVGGTAEATATGADRLRVAWNNVQQEIGTLLIPMLESLANFVITSVLPVIQQMITAFGQEGFSGVLEVLGGKFLDFTTNATGFKNVLVGIIAVVAAAAAAWLVYTVATAAAAIATMGLSAAIASIPVIGQIALIVGLIIGWLTFLVLKFQGVRDALKAIWNAYITIMGGLLNAVLGAFSAVANGVISVINTLIKAYNKLPFAPNIGELEEINLQLDLNAIKFGSAADGADEYADALGRVTPKAQMAALGLQDLDKVAAAILGEKWQDPTPNLGGTGASAAKELSPVEKYLQAMAEAAKKAREEWTKFRDGIQSSISGLLDLGAAFDIAKGKGKPQAMVKAFVQQGKDIVDYAKNLSILQSRGLGQPALQQILGMDLANGSAIAAALVQGGLKQLRQINRVFGSVSQAGLALGTQFANAVNPAGAPIPVTTQNVTTQNVTNHMTISVVSNDPNAVVRALQKYNRTNGAVPIKVTN